MYFFRRRFCRRGRYNHVNTWGVILGNYYISRLVVSIYFRGYYPTPARIWFIIIIANKKQTYNISVNLYICIYYKLPQLLVIL
jgi:hypothetical protein